jgi:hypothetical protein
MADYLIGDVVKMKKGHPCGGDTWEVLRIGMDFRIRCQTCGHSLLIPRSKFEKSVKTLLQRGDEAKTAQSRPFFDQSIAEKKQ